MSDPLREQLVLQIMRLPGEMLPAAEKLLAALGDYPCAVKRKERKEGKESGDKSPQSKKQSGDESPHSKMDWPHAPLHRLSDRGTYIVTAGTANKEHYFRGAKKLDLLQAALLRTAQAARWNLEAWAIFSNHYHFVAGAEEGAMPLGELIKRFHGKTARELNLLDDAAGRTVWQNYWDTELTYEKSYFARLSYVHRNAVKHGLVARACEYRWCSAGWFERTAEAALIKTIYAFKTDRVRVEDEFEPVL